jgi:hypothetical protein
MAPPSIFNFPLRYNSGSPDFFYFQSSFNDSFGREETKAQEKYCTRWCIPVTTRCESEIKLPNRNCQIINEMSYDSIPQGIVFQTHHGENDTKWNKPQQADKREMHHTK